MRITVSDVLSYLASGMSVEEILADFPSVRREQVIALLEDTKAEVDAMARAHEGHSRRMPAQASSQ